MGKRLAETRPDSMLNRRGVSQVVAAMLLVAITVTMAVLFYAYSAGLLGSLLPPAQQGSNNPVIENIAFSPDGTAQLTVRNLGSADSKVGSIYVDGVLKYSNPQGALIPAGQAQTFTLPDVSPTQHRFSVATLDGSGASIYGPEVIFVIGVETGTSTITTNSMTMTSTSTYTTTLTALTSSTSLTTSTSTSTWTSSNPTTYTTTYQTSQTITSTSYTTITSTSKVHGNTYTTITTTSSATITSTSTGSTTQIVTTTRTTTGTTTQTTTSTTTITSTGTTTVTVTTTATTT